MANARTRTAIGGVLSSVGLGSAFQTLRVNSGATAPEWVSGGVQLIAETVLGANTASFDFSSIPATFRHLRLDYMLRSTVAANNDASVLAFNTDTTNANYDRQLLQSGGGTNTGQEALATSGSRNISLITGANSPANHFALGEIIIHNYASTVAYKQAHGYGSAWRARTTSLTMIQWNVVFWASTTAINQITLTPSTGPNFLAGSRVSLYGIG